MQSTVLLMYQDPISASRLVVWRCCFNFPTYCHHLKAEEDQETKCVLTCWIELPHTNAAQPRRRNMKMLISTCDPCQWSEIRDQMTVAIETGQKPGLCLHPCKKLGSLLVVLNFPLKFGSCLPKFGIHQEGGSVSIVFPYSPTTDSSLPVWRHIATSQSLAWLGKVLMYIPTTSPQLRKTR